MAPTSARRAPPPEPTPGLAAALDALYREARAEVGAADLAHVRRVAAYSRAIEARGRELIQRGGGPEALRRGVVLHALHVLLEFSELGHNIMHGCYDHLPDAGPFHSERWTWDFVTDPREWKVMHHQNHHPFTNIAGKDHDVGYSLIRLLPGQDWFAHHGLQPATVALILACHLYYFTLYTATSAARVEGRPVLSAETFRASWRLIRAHARRAYVDEPLAAGRRALHTLVGNYLATAVGYGYTIGVLLLAHHAPGVALFADPGPDETPDAYARRQILATANFTPIPQVEAYLQRVLREEVRFDDPPGPEVFYGGLDTHLEHHLFPDLPCGRQRALAPRVAALCAAHGLPYRVVPLADVVPDLARALGRWAAPVGEGEAARPASLLARPRALLRRVRDGLRYAAPPPGTYLRAPRLFDAPARVVEAIPLAGGQAVELRLARPAGWEGVRWAPGAFVSLRVRVGDEVLVRQYSLLRDGEASATLDVAIKRVAGGRASNHLADHARPGDVVTLVGPPTSEGAFLLEAPPPRALFLAGGVGITPLLAMLRALARRHEAAVRRGAPPPTDAVLVYCNRSSEGILYEDELRAMAAAGWLRLRLRCDEVAAPRPGIERGRLTREVLAEVPDLATREAWACAPAGMLALAGEALRALGLPDGQLHVESFAPPPLARGADDGRRHLVRFRRAGREVEARGDETLLEAARRAGIALPTGCERGLCKACVVTKLAGRTQHDEGAAAALPRVTACTSLPRSDVELDL